MSTTEPEYTTEERMRRALSALYLEVAPAVASDLGGAVLAHVNALTADLARLCGPKCPHDGKYAVEHEQAYSARPKSFEPVPSSHAHEFELCLDCDTLSHDEGAAEHCARCYEPYDVCDGTPFIQPPAPPHPAWPDGAEWLRSRR